MRSQPSHRPRGKGARRCPALSWEPVPANAMQRMMLHYAGSVPGAYLPRQVLAIDSISDADRFLDTLGGFLGQLDPFHRRFRTARDGIAQIWLPAGRAVPVHRGAGGHRAALDWIDSEDRITSEAVLHGDPPAQLTAFCDGGTVFLGMEMHHALMDGVSNTQVLSLIDQLARQFPQGAPAIPTHHGLASRTVLRKHVACEIATHGLISTPEPLPATAATHPAARVTEIPPSRMQRISNWATGHGTDLRAALAAITAQAARETHGARAMYIVTNGRDADIPASTDALGMFWYFNEIQPLNEDTAHLAKIIHQTGAPVNRIRSAALHWPQWDTSGVAFNFTKQAMSSGQYSHLKVIQSRDVFHFAAQVSAVARIDGSGVITSTATRNASLPPFHARVLDMINNVGKPGQ